MESWHLLLVEDDAAFRGTLLEWLPIIFQGHAVQCQSVETLAEALAVLRTEPVDVVLLDLNLPDSANLATLQAVVGQAPKVPTIIVTGLPEEEYALQAIRAGAEDYIPKPLVTAERLRTSIIYAMARHRRVTAWLARLDEVSTRLSDEGATHG